MSHARFAFLAGVGSILDVGATMYRSRDHRFVQLGSLELDRLAIGRDWEQSMSQAAREAGHEGDLLMHGAPHPV